MEPDRHQHTAAEKINIFSTLFKSGDHVFRPRNGLELRGGPVLSAPGPEPELSGPSAGGGGEDEVQGQVDVGAAGGPAEQKLSVPSWSGAECSGGPGRPRLHRGGPGRLQQPDLGHAEWRLSGEVRHLVSSGLPGPVEAGELQGAAAQAPAARTPEGAAEPQGVHPHGEHRGPDEGQGVPQPAPQEPGPAGDLLRV